MRRRSLTRLQSDHPVLDSRYLLYEAQQAHYYGLPANLALASVTTTPVKAIGQEHRIGYIKSGTHIVFANVGVRILNVSLQATMRTLFCGTAILSLWVPLLSRFGSTVFLSLRVRCLR